MAPEITISTLWQWNEAAHGRNPPALPDELEDRQKRIDLVLFRHDTHIKSNQGLWALVELKRNWKVDGDIQKIRGVFKMLDTCQFGVACGVVKPDKYPNWFDLERTDLRRKGEEFVTSSELTIAGTRFVVFANLFKNPDFSGSDI